LAESPGPNLADASESKSNIVASYRLVNKYTDAYIAPHSLLFTRSGSHFVAGSDSLISVFDTGRLDSGPVQQQKTIPSKNTNLKGGGVGVKGLVSALNINNEGMLAFGTYNRHVGLYSNEGRGESVAVFTVAHDKDRLAAKELDEVAGYGVTQVAWSPCSRYLYVAERKSDVVQIYDIRVSGRLLGWLRGRNAQTHQRLGVQVVPCEDGHEVWAGGVDGVARVWRNPHESAGAGEPSFEWKAHDGKPLVAFV
jgi:WD40 repeat protein